MAKNLIDGNDTKVSESGNNITIDFSDGTNERLEQIENNIVEVNNKFNYSTEEKVVGTWIDGRPIYRKTYTGSITEPISHNLTNVSFINSYGGFTTPSGLFMPLPCLRQSFPTYQCGYYVSATQIVFDKGETANGIATITLEYTKTTDSASTLSLEDDE